MEGKRILRVETRRKDLRFPFPENFNQRIEGAKLTRLGRRAKYLVGELSNGEALIMHLGMTGRFTVSGGRPGKFHHEAGADEKHDHVVFDMQGGARVVFNDARRFGFMDLWPLDDVGSYAPFAGMGPEPISNEFSGAYLAEAFAGKKAPVKAALLDQNLVAGLGNIYVCEALHRAGIRPDKPAGRLSGPAVARLVPQIKAVLAESIEAGGSTIRDYAQPNGELGYFAAAWRVYGREGEACGCGGTVARMVQGGRSTFWCAKCQK